MTNEKNDGPISVSDGDVTPITKKPIEHISIHDWPTLSVSELYHHLMVLENRRSMASQMGKPEIVHALTQSIDQLQHLIRSKTTKDGNTIT